MKWRLEYTEKARKQLRKLDAPRRAVVLSWLDKNIDGCEDPWARGKGLTADRCGEWRCRIGDYRVLCDIWDDRLVVLAFNIEHRGKVYKRL